jgi:hypothetical protein
MEKSWKFMDRADRQHRLLRSADIAAAALVAYFQDYEAYSMNTETVGKTARIGLVPTSWDLREECFQFGAEVISPATGHVLWQPYDKAECIEAWLAGELHPDVMVRCNSAPGFAQLSPWRPMPPEYRHYYRK